MQATTRSKNAVRRRPLALKPTWRRSACAEVVGLALLVGLPLIFVAGAILSPGTPTDWRAATTATSNSSPGTPSTTSN